MAPGMSRPTKHSATGVYEFRKAIPPALRAAIGKGERYLDFPGVCGHRVWGPDCAQVHLLRRDRADGCMKALAVVSGIEEGEHVAGGVIGIVDQRRLECL